MHGRIEVIASDSCKPIYVDEYFFDFCKRGVEHPEKHDLFDNESPVRSNRCKIPDAINYGNSKRIYYQAIDYETLSRIVKWVDHHKKNNRMTQKGYKKNDFLSGPDRLTLMSEGFELSNRYMELEKYSDNISDWDRTFLKMPFPSLIKLYKSASEHYMESLSDMCAKTIADLLKDKTTDEIQELFNITKKLSNEELKEIKREYSFIQDY